MSESLEMYKIGSTIKVEVRSISEFQILLEQAEKEACQLQQTLSKLRNFTIDVQFVVDRKEIISSQ